MKCEYCGGNLSLENAFCSHCGQPNPHAEQHIKDMNRYKGEFENTKKSVYKKTQTYTEITVRIAIIAVLFILIVAMLMLGKSAYRITVQLEENKAERNFSSYSIILDEYLEEENYQQFIAFIDRKNIPLYDSSYEKYAGVGLASRYYVGLYEYIMEVVMPISYRSELSENVERMASQLDYFYNALDREKYMHYEGADGELYVTAMENMEKNVENLLVTYLNISPEDAAQLKEMTSVKRAYLIEESIDNE